MSDGESAKQSSYTSSPASDVNSAEATQQSGLSSNEGQDVAFDLTDPNDLEVKLDQLSEQDMEQLLKQAYKVNQELKRELHRQERAESGQLKAGRSKSKGSLSASSKGISSPLEGSLPPIRNKSGSKGFTSLHHRSSAQHHTASPVNPSRHKAKTAVQTPSNKPRPEWDDRFNL